MIRPIDEYRAMSTEQLTAQLARYDAYIRALAAIGDSNRFNARHVSHHRLIKRVLAERNITVEYSQPIVSKLTRDYNKGVQ